MLTFYSHGKLLITAEYAVLKGARALAIPCKKGQKLTVEQAAIKTLKWSSFDWEGQLWFEVLFEFPSLNIVRTSDTEKAMLLQHILFFAKKENPSFLSQGGEVKTYLEFDRLWGLGSSSTLISNLAQWAKINPYLLLENSFGGSGYDVACSLAKGALFFTKNHHHPKVQPLDFSPSFLEQLHLVYLNQKKDSQQAVKAFDLNAVRSSHIKRLNALTDAIASAKNLQEFEVLIEKHELLIGNLIQQKPVKQRLFEDFHRSIKSLGAWGGDFILATGGKETPNYFKQRGFSTVIPFKELCLMH